KLARRGVAVEMPLRRSRVDALDVITYESGVARLDLRVTSGTYVRAIADALGGHCRTLRRLEIGPFSVEEADPQRMISPDDAMARLGGRSLVCPTSFQPPSVRLRSGASTVSTSAIAASS